MTEKRPTITTESVTGTGGASTTGSYPTDFTGTPSIPSVWSIPQPQPNVCPGCGRCRQCGQPTPGLPSWPYPGPTWIYQPYYTVTCTTGTGS